MDHDARLVCFDLNKTLIHESTWEDLNLAMGVTKQEDEEFLRWYERGEITYEQGQKFLEDIYRKKGRSTRVNMERAVSGYTYSDGAREVIAYLKNKGYEVALLSGSVDILVEKVADELGISWWAAHNKFLFDEEGIFRKIMCEGDDADFKLVNLQKFCKKLGVKPEQCVCVGDGYNDRKIFAATGRGVTVRGSKVEDIAWKVVEKLSDLRQIL